MPKTVLVTGCRSGFGLLTAREAARAGWTVYAGLRDLGTAERLERETRGLSVHPLQLDVTRPAEREAAVSRVLEEQGRIDALVNNAGVGLGGFLEMVEEDELRRLMEVNFFAVWALTRACLPAMRAAGQGRIVMVSSESGQQALPGLGSYAASKHALEGMSEAWRHELRPFGIWVTCVEPGAFRTDIFGRNLWVCRNSEDQQSPYAPYVRKALELYDQTVDRIARDPIEVARKIVALLEDPRPPLRNPIGPLAWPRALARRFLPFYATELIMGELMRRAREG